MEHARTTARPAPPPVAAEHQESHDSSVQLILPAQLYLRRPFFLIPSTSQGVARQQGESRARRGSGGSRGPVAPGAALGLGTKRGKLVTPGAATKGKELADHPYSSPRTLALPHVFPWRAPDT